MHTEQTVNVIITKKKLNIFNNSLIDIIFLLLLNGSFTRQTLAFKTNMMQIGLVYRTSDIAVHRNRPTVMFP